MRKRPEPAQAMIERTTCRCGWSDHKRAYQTGAAVQEVFGNFFVLPGKVGEPPGTGAWRGMLKTWRGPQYFITA